MADITSISMEHEDGDAARMLLISPDEEGAERLSIRGRDEELFEVGDAKLHWPWDIRARIGWKASRIDDFAMAVSGVRVRGMFELVLLLEVEEATEDSCDARGRKQWQPQVGHEVVQCRRHVGGLVWL